VEGFEPSTAGATVGVSNDNDFRDTGVEWYTTAELLQRLGIHGNK
jgi:hypothetical protein